MNSPAISAYSASEKWQLENHRELKKKTTSAVLNCTNLSSFVRALTFYGKNREQLSRHYKTLASKQFYNDEYVGKVKRGFHQGTANKHSVTGFVYSQQKHYELQIKNVQKINI